MAEILVVDDDQSVAAALERVLEFDEHTCLVASNAADASRMIAEREPALVLMDVRMPGTDGLQALQDIRQHFQDVYVVIMTAYGTSQTSIDAIRAGAFDYLIKPLDLEQVRGVVAKALVAQRIRDSGTLEIAAPVAAAVTLIGESPALQEVYKIIGRLATNDVAALVVGERGTGKQLVVRTIHENSVRRGAPFVSLDCRLLAAPVLEEAIRDGRQATLHLSSVDALTPALQAHVLQALSERVHEATRSGAPRIIASTQTDLAGPIAAGAYSRELYEALAVATIRLPPLRERSEDVPRLVRYFVQRFNQELNRSIRGIDDRLSARLLEHTWPGNVSELQGVVKRACIMSRSDVLTADDIGDSLNKRLLGRPDVEGALARAARTTLQEWLVERPGTEGSSAFHQIVGLVEETLVAEALLITGGNQVKAADILGVNRATLRKKIV